MKTLVSMIALCTTLADRRGARSPVRIGGVGDGTQGGVREGIERQVRDEMMDVSGLLPLSWLMIGQWARKP